MVVFIHYMCGNQLIRNHATKNYDFRAYILCCQFMINMYLMYILYINYTLIFMFGQWHFITKELMLISYNVELNITCFLERFLAIIVHDYEDNTSYI